MPDRTSRHDTTQEYPPEPLILGVCCCTAGAPNVYHAIAHLYGLQRHLEGLGLRAEAIAVSTILDMVDASRGHCRDRLPW